MLYFQDLSLSFRGSYVQRLEAADKAENTLCPSVDALSIGHDIRWLLSSVM